MGRYYGSSCLVQYVFCPPQLQSFVGFHGAKARNEGYIASKRSAVTWRRNHESSSFMKQRCVMANRHQESTTSLKRSWRLPRPWRTWASIRWIVASPSPHRENLMLYV